MGKKKQRITVIFLDDHMKMAAEALNPRDRGRLFEMIRAYSMEGKEADVSRESRMFRSLYVMMRRAQDDDIENYKGTCERNRRNAMKRSQRSVTSRDAVSPVVTSCSQYNTVQSNTIQSNTIQSNTTHSGGEAADDSLNHEGTGVPGVGWL